MEGDRFDVQFTRQVEKDLKDLRGLAANAMRIIRQLEENPELGHALSESLQGARSLEFNLKGSGAHRAVYVIFPVERVCIVFIIGPHEGIYARAERRASGLLKS